MVKWKNHINQIIITYSRFLVQFLRMKFRVEENSKREKALTRYYSILEGNARPKFKLLKESKFNEKIKEAYDILKSCELCARACHVDRTKGQLGFCKVGLKWKIFGAHVHLGEEADIIPSATLFLAGCTLRCCYCQNAPDSITPESGDVWSDKEVAKWIDNKSKEGCKNVNFVTPDCYVWNILKVLKLVKGNIPVVWNSSSYYSEKTANLIKDFVDVYLLDFRYFDDKCAEKLSQASKYVEAAKRNFLIANKNGELLIRVLIIPGHIECDAKPILKWIKENLGENTRVNVMEQYYSTWHASKFEEINRRLTIEEYDDVLSYAKRIGLKNLV